MSGITRQLMRSSGAINPAWDLAYAYYDPSPGTSWSLPGAKFLRTFSVGVQEADPTGLFFRPDGLKMYVSGGTGDDINEYDLSVAWDLTTAVFLQNFSVAAQETAPVDVFFKPDGTKMYVLGSQGDDVTEYVLPTAWDVSTAGVYGNNFSVAGQDNNPSGVTFKPDGTKVYVTGTTGNSVSEYDLSTAWVVSSATFVQSFSVNAQETIPTGVTFKPDGTKMYVCGTTGDGVDEYTLSTPWDVSTATFSFFLSLASQDTGPQAIFFKPDGSRLYMLGGTGDGINEYDLSGFSVAAQDTAPTDVFFKPDGLKMYVLGDTDNDINEYNLSTAWDVSTAVFLQNFSVAAQDINPAGLFFKPDGTKMYMTGISSDSVHEYDLSVAWDVSTAVLLQSFSVTTEERSPEGVFFKPDGTKMFITGSSDRDVYEYDLSTAWDISTATFSKLFDLGAYASFPEGLFFRNDGTKMFIIGSGYDKVFEFSLAIQS